MSRHRIVPLPAFVPPQLTALVPMPPEGEDWLHEIKFDGYRMHARIERGGVRLLTRTGLNWTDKYRPIAEALATLPVMRPISTASCAACAPTARPRSA